MDCERVKELEAELVEANEAVDALHDLLREAKVERDICYKALKRIWKEWCGSLTANDPNAEGYDTLQMVKAAVEAVERRKKGD